MAVEKTTNLLTWKTNFALFVIRFFIKILNFFNQSRKKNWIGFFHWEERVGSGGQKLFLLSKSAFLWDIIDIRKPTFPSQKQNFVYKTKLSPWKRICRHFLGLALLLQVLRNPSQNNDNHKGKWILEYIKVYQI